MIFYLSGTGNTKWVAESIAHELGERLIDVTKELDGDATFELSDGERVGFCFPVHGWRPPKLFLDFIHRMEIKGIESGSTYIYIVCTVGDTVGEAVDILQRELKDKGVAVSASFDVKMPNTYVGLPFMDVDSKNLETEKLLLSKDRVAEICKELKLKECGKKLLYKGKWPKTNSRVLGELFVKYLITDSHFCVDAEKCIKCGKCVGVCPVGDIDGGVGLLPHWKGNKKCMTCFACYHNCPKHAIQYGMMTKGKGQYNFKVR